MQKWFDNVVDKSGNAQPNATVTVTLSATGALATIYSDNGVTTKSNPIAVNGDPTGYYEFYAANGKYTLTFGGPGVTAASITNVQLLDIAGVDATQIPFTQAGTGAVPRSSQEKGQDIIDLRDFLSGAEKADLLNASPSFDLTSKLLAAQTQAETFGSVNGKYPIIQLPAGNIGLNNFVWTKVVSLVGREVGNTRLVYVGTDNVADSYLIGLQAGAGAIPYAGFYNIDFVCFDSTSSTGPACAHGIMNLGTNLDWGFKLQNLHFLNSFDDAMQLRGTASVPVNLYLNRIRFDGIGGFGVYLGSNNVNSGTPVVLDQFTMDNNIGSNVATKMAALGYYDGSRWGKGLMRIEDGQNLGLRISNARIEMNKKMIAHNGGFALIYSNNTLSGTRCLVSVENLQGTGRTDQPVSVVRDVTGRTDCFYQQISMSSYARIFADDTKPERDTYHNQVGTGFIGALTTQQLGLNVYGHALEFRPNAPEQVSGNFASYKFGDTVFNSTLGVGRPAMWQMKSPTTGFAIGATNNITTTAVVTSGVTTVTVGSTTFANLAIGLNITIVGAGVAAADLPTRVTAVDETTTSITIADVPSTSVNPATIKFAACQFGPTLYVPGVSADRGNVGATLNLGVDAPTQYWNTALTANRAVTLGTSASSLGTVAQANGGKFRIVRTAASTGAFTLDITHNAGTKSLSAGQWADVEFNGSVWILTAAGSL